jgi:DNA primase
VLESGDGPKYLNSPETPVFVKGRELYGLHEARQAIRKAGHALVVEGYLDVVVLAQHGLGQAVATLGTACTAEHVQKLARFTDQIVFSFDGDAAGRRAAGRALEAALPHAGDTTTFRFLFLPPEHDPDSFVRAEGAAAYERAVATAMPLSRFLVASASEGLDLATAEGRASFLGAARPLWSALSEGMLKRQLLGELARQAALEVDELAAAWESRTGRTRQGGGAVAMPARPSRGGAPARRPRVARRPEDSALRLLLLESSWWEELAPDDHELLCALPGWHGEAVRLLDRAVVERGAVPWAALREQLAAEPWGADALAAVEGDHLGIEPQREDLTQALAQMRKSPLDRQAMQVLNWK